MSEASSVRARTACARCSTQARSPVSTALLAASASSRLLRTETHYDPLIGLSPFSLVLDEQPAVSVASGASADVDLLVGTTTEEGHLYLVPVDAFAASDAADVTRAATAPHPSPLDLVETYRASRPRATSGELRSAIMGDALFGAGSWALAEAHASRAPSSTFAYEFAWRSEALDGQLGATHAVELPFVFDTTGLPVLNGPNALLGPRRPPTGLATRMHEAWVRFARTGDPGWARYDDRRRSTMHIDAEWAEVEDPRSEERQAWSADRRPWG
ncbi:carboxylesterase family protein [Promicromonospora iranensis]|uniref:Carboxylesterase type B n=1 Tax=Promicromonospora iranensis TaxID=1105144 RepID=A0ABU2CUV2_9MICO|nr:carboxylesterase family protein [Promicromonospora iranensis]MDR7385093.1 carboxylesterase type B [Promicromonospora iranensis]